MLTGLHHLAQSRSCDAAAREPSQYGECISLPGDISSLDGVNALAAAIAERQPTLDILVNNAGAAWGQDFDSFPERGWDKVINIAYVDGIAVNMMETDSYAASKAGLIHLTKRSTSPLAPAITLSVQLSSWMVE